MNRGKPPSNPGGRGRGRGRGRGKSSTSIVSTNSVGIQTDDSSITNSSKSSEKRARFSISADFQILKGPVEIKKVWTGINPLNIPTVLEAILGFFDPVELKTLRKVNSSWYKVATQVLRNHKDRKTILLTNENIGNYTSTYKYGSKIHDSFHIDTNLSFRSEKMANFLPVFAPLTRRLDLSEFYIGISKTNTSKFTLIKTIEFQRLLFANFAHLTCLTINEGKLPFGIWLPDETLRNLEQLYVKKIKLPQFMAEQEDKKEFGLLSIELMTISPRLVRIHYESDMLEGIRLDLIFGQLQEFAPKVSKLEFTSVNGPLTWANDFHEHEKFVNLKITHLTVRSRLNDDMWNFFIQRTSCPTTLRNLYIDNIHRPYNYSGAPNFGPIGQYFNSIGMNFPNVEILTINFFDLRNSLTLEGFPNLKKLVLKCITWSLIPDDLVNYFSQLDVTHPNLKEIRIEQSEHYGFEKSLPAYLELIYRAMHWTTTFKFGLYFENGFSWVKDRSATFLGLDTSILFKTNGEFTLTNIKTLNLKSFLLKPIGIGNVIGNYGLDDSFTVPKFKDEFFQLTKLAVAFAHCRNAYFSSNVGKRSLQTALWTYSGIRNLNIVLRNSGKLLGMKWLDFFTPKYPVYPRWGKSILKPVAQRNLPKWQIEMLHVEFDIGSYTGKEFENELRHQIDSVQKAKGAIEIIFDYIRSLREIKISVYPIRGVQVKKITPAYLKTVNKSTVYQLTEEAESDKMIYTWRRHYVHCPCCVHFKPEETD